MAVKHTFIASEDGLYKHYEEGRPKEECFKTAEITPIKAIRAKCLECSNYRWAEIKKCEIWYCPLFPFRFGRAYVSKHAVEFDTGPSTGGNLELNQETNTTA